MKYVTKGTVAAFLSVCALVAGLLNKQNLATYLGADGTADAVIVAVTSVMTIVAGVASGVKS